MVSDTGGAAAEVPAQAAIAESHTAVVAFIGDRAYKIKKPVDFGFLDFRTVPAREAACRRELELNRRLAPDVYLDIDQVLDGSGQTRDWIVVMRRMPAALRLSTLVQSGADVRADLRRLARMLASFHSVAGTGPEVSAAGRPVALRRRWVDNFAGAAPFVGRVLDPAQVDEIRALALRYLDGRSRLLEHRIQQSSIVDGHGDLQAEDIFCLPDGPRVLDCLEFDDGLRYVDVLDDAAFLAMDLERLGAADLGVQFLRWYREFSGTTAPHSLAHHYIAYRAFVRSKVACLRHDQGAPEAAATARQLAGIAVEHLRTAEVRLILVGGAPATGKSTLAAGLAERLDASVVRTDDVRRDLPGAAQLNPHAGYGRGLYDPQQVHATYDELLGRARTLLELGETVILDATWNDPNERAAARSLAADTAATLSELRCDAPTQITTARLASRADDASDATAEVATRMAATFPDWPQAVAIDTSVSVAQSVAAACDVIKLGVPSPAR